MTKILVDKTVIEQALEALKIGHESAHDCAETFHIEMAGYKQQRHEALDAEVKQISDAIGALRAALEQPQVQSGGIPPNWKLVPVEPTPEMLDAGRNVCEGRFYPQDMLHGPRAMMADSWAAMLATAPQPPVVEQPQIELEPVAWQFRMRMVDDEEWPDWCNCLKDVAESCWHTPVLRGRQREARALYTHPQPKREQQGEVND